MMMQSSYVLRDLAGVEMAALSEWLTCLRICFDE
ncbi:hypothetical protein Psta_1959 [Pirellula staleyi DSM 6068]|uniref:Uncharacterized protein n=1 Tax=Pirellula staleyi (strain ATCC 27377 / DSM 6068 / ICPB 4128) TaxID=530564 RepID=D2R0N5_PIRSD|nr:hypothetical protein Psta_1959 [Pirellula staleyi DSM 6068]